MNNHEYGVASVPPQNILRMYIWIDWLLDVKRRLGLSEKKGRLFSTEAKSITAHRQDIYRPEHKAIGS